MVTYFPLLSSPKCLSPSLHPLVQSVYGLIDEGQSQSPVHTPSQIARKGTKADVEKEVLLCVILDVGCSIR